MWYVYLDSSTDSSDCTWESEPEQLNETGMEMTRMFNLRDRILKTKNGRCAKFSLVGYTFAKKANGKKKKHYCK